MRGWNGEEVMDTSSDWRKEWLEKITEWFPELIEHVNFELTSEVDFNYNCLSWALSYTDKYLVKGKGCHWPWKDVPDDTVEGWAEVCRRHGFESIPRENIQFVPGIEKIAILVDSEGELHAARQDQAGWWKSKLGSGPDIDHATLDGIASSYGTVVHVLQKMRSDWL
jgi:hypothetical protein